ncbi:hypothetical protein K9N68_00735 [Kovacikia minuta CCNUW1]|uniref:hypothetical protein n=1 Tax=Kovacikia minuta TaxID=2931930 RepID=UPI001CCAA3D5|nr:hypothetical protein [Kovacikia minuta]UBF26573.1 hypothetical protein K9N68_00735 [Kovacikia minuta CCNUW1]
MHPQIEAILDKAENHYLSPEELGIINQYVESLPARLEAYRSLRDRELEIMQQVANQLQATMPQEKIENLERSLKNGLLLLRYCAMGMLLNDESFVQERLLGWLSATLGFYNIQTIDTTLYRLLNQQLAQTISPIHVSLLNPMLTKAQNTLQQSTAVPTLVG